MIAMWEILRKEVVYRAQILKHFQLHARSTTNKIEGMFDVVECSDWCTILPVTKNNEVILVKQYRHGIDDITLELPGGSMQPGEDPLESAKRELLEEAGCTYKKLKKLGESHVNPAFMTNSCHFFLAEGAEITQKQSLDALEEIDVVLVSFADFEKKIKKGEITHSLVHAAYMFYLMQKK